MRIPDLSVFSMKGRFSLTAWTLILAMGCILLLLATIGISLGQHISEKNRSVVLTTRMIERSVTRTLQSLESTLHALASEVVNDHGRLRPIPLVRQSVRQSIRFSPHIRQLVLVHQGEVLIDSRRKAEGQPPAPLLLSGADSTSPLAAGLQIGSLIQQRFLPLASAEPAPATSHTLVPVSYSFTLRNGQRIYLIAALNTGYLQQLIEEGRADRQAQIGLYLVDGQPLIGDELPAERGRVLQALIDSGHEERPLQQTAYGAPSEFAVARLSSRYPVGIVQRVRQHAVIATWVYDNRLLLSLLGLATIMGVITSIWHIRGSRQRRALQQKVDLLSASIAQSPVSVMITDRNKVIQYVNPAFCSLMGYRESEVLQQRASMLKSGLTPDSTYRSLKDSLNQGRAWQGEFINRTRGGEIITVFGTISSLVEARGEVTHHIGVMRDVTHQKDAEKELRIAAAAFEVQAGMVVTDRNAVILRVNQAFTKVTGYQPHEVIGKTPAVLKSGRHDHRFYGEMYLALAQAGYWEGEIWNRRKNGEVFPEWLVVSAVKDEQGELSHYVAAFNDISERKAAEEQIIHLAFYDPLTQLPNRRMFNERLPHATHTSQRTGAHCALLLIDLDYFKTVNDTRGHDVGDALLIEAASRLRGCLREADTVARLGGDEFVVLLENLDPQPESACGQAERVADKICARLREPYSHGEQALRISASIGIAPFQGTALAAEELFKHADIALYATKDAGRNGYSLFSTEMMEELSQLVEMEQALREALKRRQLLLYLQPQFDHEMRMIGAEALIRWPMADDFVSPARFIPLAERSDLILALGDWVLEEACRQLNQISHRGIPAGFQLAVNISAKQFSQPDFTDNLLQILRRHDISPRLLKLELTENLMLQDINAARAAMSALRRLGMGIELDDFGTGFSSLNYLKSLPIDGLKIDRSFVRDLDSSEESAAIVRTTIQMAKALKLRVIAEGVETGGQLAFLQAHGCHAYQGFLLSPPLAQAAFEASYLPAGAAQPKFGEICPD
ncbi:sensor domain-containing protein [Marinobacterium arenosum]|uniref:sensor domain-containing protein n=1 Tax=Marinobacterium arenosum TaxID=2862496 RepID=UPI001C947C10|nr:bifunctional diguanylate cyclase/phosphodiesterase [Marinobacterium arenosum]MBY4677006.1 EAL domain-containing protein [Marinobacterium arenosum]